MASVPDLFPPLCVLAACSRGETTLLGSPGLRHKECDRIAAMAEGLTAAGVDVEERPDGLIVHGGTLRGASVHAYNDHRIQMAFSVLGLVSDEPIVGDAPQSVNTSFPGFYDLLAQLN